MLKYVCEFTVEGCGEFPLDMLRYDRCSPFDSRDAAAIGLNPYTTAGLNAYGDDRQINLIRFTEGKGKNFNDKPTERRWQSFGWKVVKVEYRKL